MSIDFRRKIILWTLVIDLAGPHLTGAANQQVVGKVVRSSGASMGGAAVPDGETIITGDVLTTGKGGSALVKLSATTQASLGEETTVLFSKNTATLSAHVSSGTLAMETLGRDAPIVETSEYKTHPVEPGNAIYVVAVLPDKSTIITSHRGKISIREVSSGRSYLLAEGYMAVSGNSPPQSDDPPGQEKEQPKQEPGIPSGQAQGKPVEAPKSNKTLLIVLAGAAVAGGVVAASAAGGGGGGAPASPSRP